MIYIKDFSHISPSIGFYWQEIDIKYMTEFKAQYGNRLRNMQRMLHLAVI